MFRFYCFPSGVRWRTEVPTTHYYRISACTWRTTAPCTSRTCVTCVCSIAIRPTKNQLQLQLLQTRGSPALSSSQFAWEVLISILCTCRVWRRCCPTPSVLASSEASPGTRYTSLDGKVNFLFSQFHQLIRLGLVSFSEEKAIYLDPHFCQTCVDFRSKEFPTNVSFT